MIHFPYLPGDLKPHLYLTLHQDISDNMDRRYHIIVMFTMCFSAVSLPYALRNCEVSDEILEACLELFLQIQNKKVELVGMIRNFLIDKTVAWLLMLDPNFKSLKLNA